MSAQQNSPSAPPPNSFGEVVDSVAVAAPIQLSIKGSRALVAVSAKLQGRVLTSTTDGWSGRSLGWVNEKLISSGEVQKHFNAYGGEDRIWVAPEGGQFSVFFAPGSTFDLDHWFTPAAIDTEPYDVVKRSREAVTFRHDFILTNYSGSKFPAQIEREVRILPDADVWKDLHVAAASNLKIVAFESNNRLKNVGKDPWTRKTGLLSLWVLGQFAASPSTTIVIPIHPGAESDLGPRVNGDYFGPIPHDRLVAKENAVYFKADAESRGKLGINPKRARGLLGSYDAQHHVLTIVQHTLAKPDADFVNNAWKIQDNPFNGDEANSYNDGPSASGARLGAFYELESVSAAMELKPGESVEHTQRTIHLEGDEKELDRVAHEVLGVGLSDIENAFAGK